MEKNIVAQANSIQLFYKGIADPDASLQGVNMTVQARHEKGLG
jgi:hypothetical protein